MDVMGKRENPIVQLYSNISNKDLLLLLKDRLWPTDIALVFDEVGIRDVVSFSCYEPVPANADCDESDKKIHLLIVNLKPLALSIPFHGLLNGKVDITGIADIAINASIENLIPSMNLFANYCVDCSDDARISTKIIRKEDLVSFISYDIRRYINSIQDFEIKGKDEVKYSTKFKATISEVVEKLTSHWLTFGFELSVYNLNVYDEQHSETIEKEMECENVSLCHTKNYGPTLSTDVDSFIDNDTDVSDIHYHHLFSKDLEEQYVNYYEIYSDSESIFHNVLDRVEFEKDRIDQILSDKKNDNCFNYADYSPGKSVSWQVLDNTGYTKKTLSSRSGMRDHNHRILRLKAVIDVSDVNSPRGKKWNLTPEMMWEQLDKQRRIESDMNDGNVSKNCTYCPGCGTRTPNGAKFCMNCGCKLDH